MFGSLISATSQWFIWIILGVLLVVMIIFTILPQKKRKKQQETMMNSLVVGTKIMTIGRMVGKITQVNSDNTLIINVGTDVAPTLIVIDKNAVGLVLENVAQPVPAPVEPVVEEAAKAESDIAVDPAEISEPFAEETANEEVAAEEPAAPVKPAKTAKKSKK